MVSRTIKQAWLKRKSLLDLLARWKQEKTGLGAEILSSKKGRRKVATKAEDWEDLFRAIGCPVDRGKMCI